MFKDEAITKIHFRNSVKL